MSDREVTTLVVVSLFLAIFMSMIVYSTYAGAATRIGPETVISMSDLCPEGTN